MPPSLSELKVLPSLCFTFKIPDNVAVTNKYGVRFIQFYVIGPDVGPSDITSRLTRCVSPTKLVYIPKVYSPRCLSIISDSIIGKRHVLSHAPQISRQRFSCLDILKYIRGLFRLLLQYLGHLKIYNIGGIFRRMLVNIICGVSLHLLPFR